MKTKVTYRGIAIALIIVLIASIVITVNFFGLGKVASAAENAEFMEIPQITVLTHGLSSSASYWSNPNGNGAKTFAEDIDSLVYKLSEKAGGAYIYRAETDNGATNTPTYTLSLGYSDTNADINDVSKHIIIVLDSKNSKESNDVVYNELENMLMDVINKVASLNPGNKKPKVNLIGHSRGGITNLQFALDHPEYVDSMISIGTPYFGSPVAGLAGPLVFDENDGMSDINNETIYNNYYTTWINGYESKYKDINSIAIGATTTIEYQMAILNSLHGQYWDMLYMLLNFYQNDMGKQIAITYGGSQYDSLVESYPTLGTLFTKEEFVELLILIGSEVYNGVWYGDVLVPVESQQGISGDKNYLFTKYVREFSSEWASTTPKRATDQVAVIHNIETYDANIHNYILNNIVMKTGDEIDNEISNVDCDWTLIDGGISANRVSKWYIKIRNTHDTTLTYAYNSKMCFLDDAQNWTGLTDVEYVVLDPGETAIVGIVPNGSATSIAVSYISGNTRYIEYADNLWFNQHATHPDPVYKMIRYSNSKGYNGYTQNSMKVRLLGKNVNTWLVELTNNTGKGRTFYYNSHMCYAGDAQNWIWLEDVKSIYLASGAKTETPLEITENATATSIAISYTEGIQRYIFYAYDLDTSGTMSSFGNVKPQIYDQNGISASIVGKTGNTWAILVTNNTGEDRTFYYNEKMCYAGDAEHWTGLADERSVYIDDGASTTIYISENMTATSIVISYKIDIDRYIFYAYDLDADTWTMTSFGSVVRPVRYTQNGMTVAILGKNGNTWEIYLRNDTNGYRTFEYNTKMCYAGDAEKWSGLSDPGYVSLNPGQSTTIYISENFSATSIAISYMDGVYRRIFYAHHLDEDTATMQSFASTVDTTVPPESGCVAPGTMITLADGTQKAVEELTGDEMLLVWNMETGAYDSAPILFIDSEQTGHYEVIEATFSDGTTAEIISEHGFWDTDLNEYVYLDENADDYIGHSFLKKSGDTMTEVTLTNVEISTEITEAYSPVTYGHLCYYVNGMLSMPGGVTGLMNIFDVDPDTLTIDEEAYAADIAEYGLFTYEEFYESFPVPEEIFDAFNGKYLKVSIGKGLITADRIGALIERYAEFF